MELLLFISFIHILCTFLVICVFILVSRKRLNEIKKMIASINSPAESSINIVKMQQRVNTKRFIAFRIETQKYLRQTLSNVDGIKRKLDFLSSAMIDNKQFFEKCSCDMKGAMENLSGFLMGLLGKRKKDSKSSNVQLEGTHGLEIMKGDARNKKKD